MPCPAPPQMHLSRRSTEAPGLKQDFNPFTFAIIADSHFQLPGTTEQSAYVSDARHNARNRFVVETINHSSARFVVHGGDVPHPVPELSSHRAALAIASETYARLKVPLHVVPGNHDVGDKPNAWKVASGADADRHAVFSEYWGAAPIGTGFVTRCAHEGDTWALVHATSTQATALDSPALVLFEFPRDGEGTCRQADNAIATRLVTAYLAAIAHPDVGVIIDTFVDHDRGYYPRNGVLDRRCNPRAGFHALRQISRLVRPGDAVTRTSATHFTTTAGSISLTSDNSIVLDTGDAGITSIDRKRTHL